MNSYLYFITFLAALGSLLSGFETGVINGSIFYIAGYVVFIPAMKGVVLSIALIGCFLSPFF